MTTLSLQEATTTHRRTRNEHGSLTIRAIVAAVSGLDETGPVVAAQQANQDKIGDAVEPFYGDEIAAFLSGANPENWELEVIEEMMAMHLDQVVELATLQIQGDYEQALSVDDASIRHSNAHGRHVEQLPRCRCEETARRRRAALDRMVEDGEELGLYDS